MKIATWNINSIRRRMDLVVAWLAENKPDVLCLQETKVQDADFPALIFQSAGYHSTFRGMKGYNGVATLSLREPERVMHGMHAGPDNEDARLMLTVIDGITVVNSYVPQGNSITSEKYAYKLEWFARIRRYFEEQLAPDAAAVWVGDMNVAPEPIDVYHPEKRVNDVDFHIDARTAYKEALAFGFTDVFRKLHPERLQYTYWDYFRNAFERNFGWRIDHINATSALAERCRAVDVDLGPSKAANASDHTVVWADFE
jgi:exodeoxyribonuclease III